MKKVNLLILTSFVAAGMFSCTNEAMDSFDELNLQAKDAEQTVKELENTVLVPCIDENEYSPMIQPLASSYDPSGTNFFYLKDVPFTIKNRATGKYISTNGREEEVGLSTSATSNNQRFKIDYTGVYKIYSVADGMPLTRGHREEHEDEQLVMLPKSDEPSYSSKWEIIPSNTQGYFHIQNTGYFDVTPSGLQYYSMKVNNGSSLRFGIYNGDATQDFEFTPLIDFQLESVEYGMPRRYAKITKLTPHVVTAVHTNNQNVAEPYTFAIRDYVTETSRFAEDKYINFTVTNARTMRFQRPSVYNGTMEFVPDQEAPYDAQYTSSTQNIRRELTAAYMTNVPAHSKLTVNYKWNVYQVETEYIVTIVNGGIACSLVGTWYGKLYVDDIPYEEQEWELEDLNTGVKRMVKMSDFVQKK